MLNAKLLMALPLAALIAGVAAHSPARAQDGMVVVRDPQTGELRAPTAAEHKALMASGAGASLRASQASVPQLSMQAERTANGSRKVSLGERGQVFEVVTRGPDGKLTQQCIQGEEAATRAATQPATHHQEPRHEDR